MKLFVDILKWLIDKILPRTFKNQILYNVSFKNVKKKKIEKIKLET